MFLRLTLTLSLMLIPALSFAQEDISAMTEAEFNALSTEEQQKIIESIPPSLVSPSVPANTPGAVSCFDYYTFGSVQADLSPTLGQTLPGTPLTFVGKLKNANSYPIVDGQVWAKIFKKDQQSEALTKQNGYPLVDFFLVKEGIVLQANGEQDITFDWNVPSTAGGGEYEATFFFTSAHRFNLLGLTFTDDVTGNKASFQITSDNEPVVFDKNIVMLNDTLFRFAAFPPRFAKDETVTVYTSLINPSNEQRIVEVTWVTSRWDGILNANEIKREATSVLLKPGEIKKVSYTPPVLDSSVTFLQAEINDHGAKSLMHIRFVRDGNEEIRINFPSITTYPLKGGEEATIFSCLHSTNLPMVTDNTLTLTLKDHKGNTVHTYTYTGDVTGDMMGLKDIFTPEKDLTSFSLTATLVHKGTVVDEVTQTYDCTELGAECPKDTPPITVTDTTTTPLTMYTMLGSVVALLILAGVAIYQRRQKQLSTTMHNPE